MNRVLTIASSGLIAAGLAIMPISAFAQGGQPSTGAAASNGVSTGANTDVKPRVTTPSATVTTGAASTGSASTGSAPAGAKVSPPAKVGNQSNVAKPTTPAPAATSGAKVSTAPAQSGKPDTNVKVGG